MSDIEREREIRTAVIMRRAGRAGGAFCVAGAAYFGILAVADEETRSEDVSVAVGIAAGGVVSFATAAAAESTRRRLVSGPDTVNEADI